jgi:hypothetical protein
VVAAVSLTEGNALPMPLWNCKQSKTTHLLKNSNHCNNLASEKPQTSFTALKIHCTNTASQYWLPVQRITQYWLPVQSITQYWLPVQSITQYWLPVQSIQMNVLP